MRAVVSVVSLTIAATLALAAIALPRASAAPPEPAGAATGWAVQPSPFRLDIASEGVRLTSLGGRSAAFEFTDADGIGHRLTRLLSETRARGRTMYLVATDAPGRTATVSVRRIERGVRIDLRLRPAAGVASLRVAMTASRDAHFLGTGQRDAWVDLQGAIVPLKTWNNCASNMPAPFFAGTTGFGAYLDTRIVGRIAFPGAADGPVNACDLDTPSCDVGATTNAVRACVKTAHLAVEIYPGTIANAIDAYTARVGRPRRPWIQQLALIKWRDAVAGPSELFDDIEQLQRRSLPIGWILLDNPWERGAFAGRCYGALEFDPVRFPRPRQMIEEIHARGVRMMLWISPQWKSKGCDGMPYPDGWLTGDDEQVIWDLTNPAVRAEFVRKLRALVALGVDGFKGDRGDEIDLEGLTLANASGASYQNRLPLEFARAVVEAIEPLRGTRFGAFFRAAAPGSAQLLPGFFGADMQHTMDGLRRSIRMAQSAGASGIPIWGSDTGGYNGGRLTSEVFVRWAQFSALTPIFDVGGSGANARFWELGEPTVELFRRAATLHYELIPYLYELTGEASRTGMPVVRALGLTWPDDAKAWDAELQFTVGDALLAAPVTEASRSGTVVDSEPDETRVYLPPGRWLDVFDGTGHAGGRTVVRRSTLADFPLYLRAGKALPFSFRSPSLWTVDWRPDDLIRAERQGWLLAPTTGAPARARQGVARLEARASANGSTSITLDRPAPEQQLLVFPARPTCAVDVDSKRVSRRAVDDLRARRSGWGIESTTRRALVLKLRAAGRTTIVLHPCR